MGQATAQALNKKTGLPRSTVYSVMQTLEEKGLVLKQSRKDTTFFVAKDPSSLLRIIEEERLALTQKEKCATELVEHLKQQYKALPYEFPLFNFVQGKEDVQSALTEVLDRWRVRGSAIDGVIWGYQDHTFTEQYTSYLEYRWKTRNKDEIIKLFSNKAPIEDKLKQRSLGRYIKAAPVGLEFAGNMWVFGDVLFLAVTRKWPHYSVIIQDELLSGNTRIIFEWLWKLTDVNETD